jgi:hypothetical protein
VSDHPDPQKSIDHSDPPLPEGVRSNAKSGKVHSPGNTYRPISVSILVKLSQKKAYAIPRNALIYILTFKGFGLRHRTHTVDDLEWTHFTTELKE